MVSTASILTGIALALVTGGAAVSYLWTVHRRRLEVAEGLKILAAMRWRELSNLVVEGLASAGFEPESREAAAARGQHAELSLQRDGKPWLLACKQGLTHVVTAQAVEELLRVMRAQHAIGGIIATPGRIQPQARNVIGNIELVDGPELWRLVDPLLPVSVHDEVRERAKARSVRLIGLAVAGALLLGVVIAWLVGGLVPGDDVVEPATPSAAAPAAAAPSAAAPTAMDAPPAPPVDEETQRRELAARLSELPGVDRTLWTTRSTLQVFIADPQLATDTAICQVVERYEVLRASRLQLEAPAGSERPVRFMQCRAF